jgi:hypothetical protein
MLRVPEVVDSGALGEQGLLTGTFAGGAAGRLGTEALPTSIAWIGDELIVALRVNGERRRTGHRREEDAAKRTHALVLQQA